jgi:hypothetical protein
MWLLKDYCIIVNSMKTCQILNTLWCNNDFFVMIVMLLKINYFTYMFIRIYYTNFHKTEDDKIENCILTMKSTFI